METKPLLYGLIGFFLGGLIVSIAATTFDKPSQDGPDMSLKSNNIYLMKSDAIYK